jgi:hypothetical protein
MVGRFWSGAAFGLAGWQSTGAAPNASSALPSQIRTLGIYSAETLVWPLRRLKVAGGATPGSSA